MFQNMKIYKLLCVLRVALVLIPQTGYIHPDEHFQMPEIAYGDINGYKVQRTWEFTSLLPIRSIFYPYTVTILPAMLTNILSFFQYEVNSYLLLILPRLIVCALSFLQDICIYDICVTLRANYRVSLFLYASSYVTLVYLTRTFSNSFESFLFAFYLMFLYRSFKQYQKFDDGKQFIIPKQCTFNCFMSGIILSLGAFNRPTFICFSIFPFFIWFSLCWNKNVNVKTTIFASFFMGAFSMSVCLITLDCLYYNKINNFSFTSFKLVVTPMNFVTYNLNSSNLNKHGLHSRWCHIFVNIPLLFSIYGAFLMFYSIKKMLCNLSNRPEFNLENLLLVTFLCPLLLLSVIPHQEPRFLIPLIIPLCLLYNRKNFQIHLSNKLLIIIWLSSNILLLLFYGFIHQAGVYLSLQHLNNHAKNSTVIFYETYMPPQYLVAVKENDNNTHMYDLVGIELNDFEYEIKNIVTLKNPSKVFIVFPYKVLNSDFTFEALIMSNFKFVERIDLFPHFSTENFPSISHLRHIFQQSESYVSMFYELKELFSIQIIAFAK